MCLASFIKMHKNNDTINSMIKRGGQLDGPVPDQCGSFISAKALVQ